MQSNEVIAGISGGVDSTVCCRLLQNRGLTVKGLYLIVSEAHLNSLTQVRDLSAELGIELIVEDVRKKFEQIVLSPFADAYCNGITPNPCVICNESVKFKTLTDVADRYNVRYIATGHYANTHCSEQSYVLKRAADKQRDQSYMLYRLDANTLSRLLMPLGDLTKQQVRDIASRENFSNFDARDSMDICFIKEEKYVSFLHNMGFYGKKGKFVLESGETVGEHKGVENYTVGQRKGLGLNLGKPYYIKKITESGDIILGSSSKSYINQIKLTYIRINPYFEPIKDLRCKVKIRYRGRFEDVTANRIRDSLYLNFDSLLIDPAPGQSAVLYIDDLVAGGGIIS